MPKTKNGSYMALILGIFYSIDKKLMMQEARIRELCATPFFFPCSTAQTGQEDPLQSTKWN